MIRIISNLAKVKSLLYRIASFYDSDQIFGFADEAREILTGKAGRSS